MPAPSEGLFTRRRDLPPHGGPLARLHLWTGDALIRMAGAFRAPLMLGVRLVAFDDAGRVFLVRHSYLPGWHLPGGAVDADETARQAVAREAREEGGLELTDAPTLLQLYHHRTTGRSDHVAVFVARGVRRTHAAGGTAGLEIRDGAFHPPDALPEGATPATRARIAEALGRATPGEEW